MPTLEQKRIALQIIEEALSEQNTKVIKRMLKKEIKSKLPRGLRRFIPVGKIADVLLQGVLLNFLRKILNG